MNNEKEYFAFISYKREDEKWAKWLQHKLEHYKLPSNLNGRTDLPKEIRPIFRDQSELAGGVLADEINKALINSKYLIVICSPRAAQSQWVGKEVQTFVDLDRMDKIIPFIIGGTAHAQNPEEECFPLALLKLTPEQELLGINIDEMGRDAAAVKVVAQMFGLGFDTLWQRYERESRRRRDLVIVAALLLALIGVSVAISISRQNQKIREQSQRIGLQNEEILKKNDRLLNDSIVMAAQMDSIKSRDAIITQQQDSINNTNANLELLNKSLIIERNNLKKANWETMRNYAVVVSEKSNKKREEGDYLEARELAFSVLPSDLLQPEKPYTPEAEFALRKSFENNSFIIDNIVADQYYVNIWQTYMIHSKNQIVAACCDKIGVWDAETGAMKKYWIYDDAQDCNGNCLFFNNDSSLILFPLYSDLLLIDSDTGNVVDTLKHEEAWINSVSISENSEIVAVAAVDKIFIWDFERKVLLYTINRDNNVEQIQFIDGGKYVAINDGSMIDVVDIEMQTSVSSLKLDGVVSMGVDPAGNRIAALCYDSVIRICDPFTGELIASLQGSMDEEYAYESKLVFSKDGQMLYLTNLFRPTICWDLSTHRHETLSAFPCGAMSFSSNNITCVERHIIDSSKYFQIQTYDTNVINNVQLPCVSKPRPGFGYGWLRTREKVVYRKEKQNEVPKYIIEALSEEDKILFVKSMSCSDDGRLCLVASCYYEKNKKNEESETVTNVISLFNEKKLIGYMFRKESPYDCDWFECEISPGGKYFVYAYIIDETRPDKNDEEGFYLCELDSGCVLWNPYEIDKCAFFHNDDYIVYLTEDSAYDESKYYLDIAEIQTGTIVQRINLEKEIISLTLSQDDRYIIAQEDYKSTKMWEFVPLQELIDRAKEQVERKNKTVLDIKIFTPEYGDGAGEDEDLDYDDE